MHDCAAESGTLQPNVADISAHLFALFPPDFVHHFPDAEIEIVYGPPGQLWDSRWFSAFRCDDIVKFAETRNAYNDNVYIGAALRIGPWPEKGRAKTENFLATSCAWIEYDHEGDAERVENVLKAHKLEPAFMVTTGTTPHLRQHIYFRIKGGGITDAGTLKQVNTSLRNLCDSDDVTDAIRIMRLAGCVNTPTEDKYQRGYAAEVVTIRVAREPHEYSIEQLLALAPKVETKLKPDDEGQQDSSDWQPLLTNIRDGLQLHNSIRDLAAKLVAGGLSGGAAVNLLRSMMESSTAPHNERWRQRYADIPRAVSSAQSNPQAQPAPTIDYLDMSDWHWKKPPERQWAVVNHIPLRQVTYLSGEGGVGKTIIALQLLFACVCALDWIGLMPEAGNALYFGAEDEADELWRRLYDIAAYYNVPFDRIRHKLKVTSFAGKDATLARFDRHGCMQVTPLYHQLHQDTCTLQPKFTVLDTVSDIYGGNENDRTQVSAFVGLMRGLAMASNSAVIVNGHPSLVGISTGTGTSGSTGWHNRVRSRMYFKPAETDDDALRVLEFKKNQYGPIADSVLLRWKDGVFIPEPGMGSPQKQLADRKVEDVFLTLLERFIREGRNVNHKPGPSYAPKLFAEEPEAKQAKCGKAVLEDAMRRLLLAQKIHLESYGPKSKRDDGQCRFAMGAAP
jgi:RecA-family ATPase